MTSKNLPLPLPRMTAAQIEWAESKGFRFVGDFASGEAIFEVCLDTAPLREGERYTPDGWRASREHGSRLYPKIVVHRNRKGEWSVCTFHAGRGISRDLAPRAAWTEAMNRLDAMLANGYHSINDVAPARRCAREALPRVA